MRFLRSCTMFVILLGLLIIPAVVQAQIVGAPLSDYLQLTITDQNGNDVIAPMTFSITEPTDPPDPGEPAITITIPGVTVDFVELSGTTEQLSDRLQVSPIVVTVESADLLQRTFAKLIPGTALERFEPVSIVAFSDGDNAATAGVSDTLRVIQGSYSGTSGAVVYDEVIPEEPSETIPEPRLDFVTTPVFFDVEEPLFETGGVSGVISDYVDLTDVVGFFLSSDNPGDYDNLDPAFPLRGKLVEDPETGGTVYYSLRFVSDVIPEPATFILLGTGLLFMGFIRRRRSH